MSKLVTDEYINLITESLGKINLYEYISKIIAWQDSLDMDWEDNIVYSTLDSVLDLLYDCTEPE